MPDNPVLLFGRGFGERRRKRGRLHLVVERRCSLATLLQELPVNLQARGQTTEWIDQQSHESSTSSAVPDNNSPGLIRPTRSPRTTRKHCAKAPQTRLGPSAAYLFVRRQRGWPDKPDHGDHPLAAPA